MLWIKRNLFLVVGIAISLLLLGGAGWYVYSNSEENFARDDELDKLKVELEQLKGGVFPSDGNITLVRSNIARVHGFINDGERLLAQSEVPKMTASFSVTLPRVIDELRREATNAQVEIPPKFEFTFGEVKVMPKVPSYALEPLASRLSEVRTICGVLFKARVRALERIERVVAFADEPKGMDLLTDRAEQTNVISTNILVTITPYRVVFRGFASDLSAVLNGFSSTKDFIVVRQVDVEPASGTMEGSPGTMAPMAPPMGFGGAGLPQPGLPGMAAAPPNMVPGMAPNPAGPAVRPPPPKIAGGTNVAPKSRFIKVLDEKPLRITLAIDVVKVARKSVPVPPPTAGK